MKSENVVSVPLPLLPPPLPRVPARSSTPPPSPPPAPALTGSQMHEITSKSSAFIGELQTYQQVLRCLPSPAPLCLTLSPQDLVTGVEQSWDGIREVPQSIVKDFHMPSAQVRTATRSAPKFLSKHALQDLVSALERQFMHSDSVNAIVETSKVSHQAVTELSLTSFAGFGQQQSDDYARCAEQHRQGDKTSQNCFSNPHVSFCPPLTCRMLPLRAGMFTAYSTLSATSSGVILTLARESEREERDSHILPKDTNCLKNLFPSSSSFISAMASSPPSASSPSHNLVAASECR
eukprot:762688-Hanusia_phi.AAC.2